jgi:antitoxin CptB
MLPRNALQWRCRRGTLELDVLLSRYLARCYDGASAAEQQQFQQLLALEDSDLQHLLLGHALPPPALSAVVQRLRQLTP